MWKIVIIPFVSLVVVWAWQLLEWVWVRPKKIERLFRQQGMKGSSYKFLYGDTKEADLMYQKSYSKPLGLEDDIIPRLMPNILDAVQKYGNFSFIWSGPRPRVFVTDVAHIKEIMSKYRTYRKSYKISNHINKMLVSGLAYLEADDWATARAKLNPAFHVDRLKTMVPAIQECCQVILDQWKEMTSKEVGGSCVIDVTSYLQVLTSSVLARLMFDSEYTEQIKQTFFQLSELSNLGKLAIYSFTLPGEKYLPTKKNRRAKEIHKFIRNTFTSLINERFSKRKAEESRITRDLLDILMEDLYEEEGMDERERKRIIEGIIGHCKIFFFAGYETSSNVLCWTLIILSYYQEWQNRAREEVLRVLGDNKDITSDDLTKLKIVTMIVHEILRLYPAGMEFTRLVEEDTRIGGYTIPRGTLLTCPTLMVHQSKEVWGGDAAEFNPGRFAEGVAKATKGEAAYIPFGWGPRICIAQNLSLMEIKLFVAMLVRSFTLDLSPAYVHAPYVDFTIYPQYGAPLVVKKL